MRRGALLLALSMLAGLVGWLSLSGLPVEQKRDLAEGLTNARSASGQAVQAFARTADELKLRLKLASNRRLPAFALGSDETTASGCSTLRPEADYRAAMLLRIDANGARSFEKRVALVVGEGAYLNVRTLENPPHDSASIARALQALGFTVFRGIDLSAQAMDNCLSQFESDLADADIALFYYAGHGVQITSAENGNAIARNYMVAIDAKIDDATHIATGFKQIDSLLTTMRAKARQAVFFLDACRNNPFAGRTDLKVEGRAIQAGRGFAPIDAKQGPATAAGIFIAYATAPNTVAQDAWEQGADHSPFARALLDNIAKPGYVIQQMMGQVSNDVGELTNFQQTPWTSSSLTAPLHLNGEVGELDLQAQVASRASQAASARAQGQRGTALATALAGLPEQSHAESQDAFGPIIKELYQDFFMQQWLLRGPVLGPERGAISPDGKTAVTVSISGEAWVWDTVTGQQLFQLPGEGAAAVAYSPDGTRIAAIGENKVTVWNAATRQAVFTIQAEVGYPGTIAFSPSGRRIVVASKQKFAFVIDAATGNEVLRLQGHSDTVNSASFSRDGTRILTGSGDGTVRVWDAATGQQLRSYPVQRAFRLSAAFSPDATRILTVTVAGTPNDHVAIVWDAASGSKLFQLDINSLSAAAYSPDGARIVTTSADSTLRIWNATTGKEIRRRPGGNGFAVFSPDGRWIIAYTNNAAAIYDALTGQELTKLEGQVSVESAAFAPDGRHIVSIAGRDLRVWDSFSGNVLLSLQTQRGFRTASFSPDGSRLLTATGDPAVQVWNATSGQKLLKLQGDVGTVFSTQFTPDGRFIVTSSIGPTGRVRVWDAATGAPLAELGANAFAIAVSPDGREIAGTPGGKPTIWDIATRQELRTFEGPQDLIASIVFSPDGRQILAGYTLDQRGRVWDVATGKELFTLQGHQGGVRSVAYSPNGQRIVTAGDDKTARIWDAPTGAALGIITGHEDGIRTAQFSPDGKRIVTASDDKTARVWDVSRYVQAADPVALVKLAMSQLTPDLRAKVERERIRYWQVDPSLLQ